MGSIRYVLFKVSKLLPKKQRRPFILACNILGLMTFYGILLRWTKSPYLSAIGSMCKSAITMIMASPSPYLIIGIMILLIALLIKKYWKKVQGIISMGYLVVLLLAILPYLTKGL